MLQNYFPSHLRNKMEVIIEPDKYLINEGNAREIPEPTKTEINFENIVETRNKLEKWNTFLIRFSKQIE